MRAFFAVILGMAAIPAWGRGAAAADTVTFGTDWKAEAGHGGYYQALATGIYKANSTASSTAATPSGWESVR